MNRKLLLFTLLLSAALMGGFYGSRAADGTEAQKENSGAAQSPPAKDQGKVRGDDDVVKISVTLVQIDAVVTDQRGNHVTDLKAEDFELFEDKRRQQITNFSYVSAQPVPGEVISSPTRTEPKTTAGPPAGLTRLRPDQVRRTIALVVDDLGMSFESIGTVRQTLRKFVDEQMQ